MSTHVEKLKSLKVGQHLLIETNAGELLAGTLQSINTKYFMIELDNVRDIKTNYVYQSSQTLAYTQMKSIKLMLNENEDEIEREGSNEKSNPSNVPESFKVCESSIGSTSALGDENCNESHERSDDFNIQLSAVDLQQLQYQLDCLIYIAQTDHKYHKALNDIKSQSVIGLLIDPIEMGRHRKTSLIAISTPQNIYIFDMLALGKIFREMRLILEADRPRKAIHFSHKVADHLKYRHNISLKGIFDTFLAYCVATKEKTNITLEESIQKVFSIPDIYFETDFKSVIPSIYQRPLSQAQRMTVAKKIAFQLKLYDYLLHDYMLRNFYSQCEKFSQTFCNNSDNFIVGQQLHSRSRAGYEHIQPNGNWNENLNIDFRSLSLDDKT